MRIVLNTVFLTSERNGGGWTAVTQLVHYLTSVKGNDEFIVLVNDAVADVFPVSEVSGTKVVIPLANRSRVQRILWEQTALPGVIRQYRPDLLHSLGTTSPVVASCPSVVTIYDLQVRHYPENFPPARRLYLQTLLPWSARHADRIITISEFSRQDILTQFGIAPEKVISILLGGMTDRDRVPGPAPADVAAGYDLPGHFLLSVGSSLPHKNLERLIEAFALAAPSIPDSLVILGESFANRGGIHEALERTGLVASGRVRLLPFVKREELLALYRAARAFVFPSLFEGFGIPVLEAMDCDCPVLASRATSLPEVGGDAALYFDPLNPADIAQAITRISTDPALRSDLIVRGRERAREFSWKKNADETLKVYRDVLARHK